MGNKVLINIVPAENNNIRYNAADKARTDVERTLIRNGYEVINIPYAKHMSKAIALIRYIWTIWRVARHIKKNNPDDIIIQYPAYRLGIRSIKLLMKFIKRNHLTFLIHDLVSLRTQGNMSQNEIDVLNNANMLLVHTDAMYHNLLNQGISVPMKVMWLFDYYAQGDPIMNKPKQNQSLVFAGNLDKSNFLKKLGNNLGNHTLHLYGLPIEYQWPDKIIYEGKFAPDEINDIKGDWGLVWDGDAVESCNGILGDYLKFNSSHKVSLYLASGKPVIVWNQSALASFIRKNNLGICVESLKDIPNILEEITISEYQVYLKAVKVIQEKLRSGKFLECVIE